MELKDIQNLIKFVAKSGASEVKLETDDFKITIKTQASESGQNVVIQQVPVGSGISQIPVMPPTIAPTPVAEPVVVVSADTTVSASEDNLITVKSPIIGTFYRKPAPDKAPFVEVGSVVKKGDVLCVVEAMKLFNEIESEVSGKIVKVLVDDSTPVEFDQPLFLVDPS